MSGRSGGAPRGCSNLSLQPLRATVPFQLQRGSAPLCREPKAVDKTTARPPRPTIRRTLSLDTIVGPYLQGQWPREAEAACVNDKATQLLWDRCVRQVWVSASLKAVELVAVCWLSRKRRVPLKDSVLLDRGDPGKEERGWAQALSVLGKCRTPEGESVKLEPKSVLSPFCPQVAKVRHHLQKRSRNAPPSAGYELPHGTLPAGQAAGATQTVPMMPLNRLAPRLRRSVEGLSLELEEVFVSEKPDDEHEILDIPDGHRAPVPAQRCSSGSQSEPSPSLPSPSLSPCPLDSSLPSGSPCHLDASRLSPSPPPCPMLDPEPAECEGLCSSSSASLPSFALEAPLQQPCSSSPRPNKTYAFQRIPPEGCERIRVCEEAMSACPDEQLLQSSCPDPNKVNFTPHGGSAFCPVSLLKPLLPSMDLLFRSLSVSPVTGCSGQASPTRHLGMQ